MALAQEAAAPGTMLDTRVLLQRRPGATRLPLTLGGSLLNLPLVAGVPPLRELARLGAALTSRPARLHGGIRVLQEEVGAMGTPRQPDGLGVRVQLVLVEAGGIPNPLRVAHQLRTTAQFPPPNTRLLRLALKSSRLHEFHPPPRGSGTQSVTRSMIEIEIEIGTIDVSETLAVPRLHVNLVPVLVFHPRRTCLTAFANGIATRTAPRIRGERV